MITRGIIQDVHDVQQAILDQLEKRQITYAELGSMMEPKRPRQSIYKYLKDPFTNPRVEVLEEMANALGMQLRLTLTF